MGALADVPRIIRAPLCAILLVGYVTTAIVAVPTLGALWLMGQAIKFVAPLVWALLCFLGRNLYPYELVNWWRNRKQEPPEQYAWVFTKKPEQHYWMLNTSKEEVYTDGQR